MNSYQEETWKDIEGFEGQYQISSYGKVKSLNRIDFQGQTRHEKILSYSVSKGYYRVSLCRNAKMFYFSVHRLVGIHFLELPSDYKKLTINHKDGDKTNNHYSNLEWLTQSDNNKHAYKTGLKNNKGENHGEAKLTNEQVLEIRRLFDNNRLNQRQMARKFNVSKSLIGMVVHRQCWKHI